MDPAVPVSVSFVQRAMGSKDKGDSRINARSRGFRMNAQLLESEHWRGSRIGCSIRTSGGTYGPGAHAVRSRCAWKGADHGSCLRSGAFPYTIGGNLPEVSSRSHSEIQKRIPEYEAHSEIAERIRKLGNAFGNCKSNSKCKYPISDGILHFLNLPPIPNAAGALRWTMPIPATSANRAETGKRAGQLPGYLAIDPVRALGLPSAVVRSTVAVGCFRIYSRP